MPEGGGFSPIGRMLLITAAAVAILAGMRAAGPILGPIFVALVITIAWNPGAEWLRKRGVNPTLAAMAGTRFFSSRSELTSRSYGACSPFC